MIFRIFDHVLANHTWTKAGRLCIAWPEPEETRSATTSSPEAGRQSLLARLAIRSKADRFMCRAGRSLMANPSMRLDQLAAELGVSERYLIAGLRTVLGVSPSLLVTSSEVKHAA